MVDASVRLSDPDDRWEVSLIGRNLTNEFYFVRSGETTFTGTAPNVTPAVGADIFAIVERGREVLLQFRYKYR